MTGFLPVRICLQHANRSAKEDKHRRRPKFLESPPLDLPHQVFRSLGGGRPSLLGRTESVRRQQLSDFSALLLMDTLGVVSHSRLARLYSRRCCSVLSVTSFLLARISSPRP